MHFANYEQEISSHLKNDENDGYLLQMTLYL